ncbi:WD40 repeat domain-containing protein [Streptomyces sp. NRRL F-5755]|uniref:WD40 repeat domain-containing protein n=1 Tax=Streptomyces sp. NRRL F-5755 TaxID=1519475 RepID=UPI0006AFA94D|nr:WD40 repeat domain-containing protein [Streptomyces sp. NRRL F-5755]
MERSFLTCSIAERERERLAAVRTTQRLRRFATAVSVLLVLVLAAGLIAFDQYRTSENERHRTVAEQQVALSRQLAAQSTNLLSRNPDLACLLAVRAYRTAPTKEAAESLFAAARVPLRHRLTGHKGAVNTVAVSPDGRTLATSGDIDGTVQLREPDLKLRATTDWIETAVSTGRTDLDEALAVLLRGE